VGGVHAVDEQARVGEDVTTPVDDPDVGTVPRIARIQEEYISWMSARHWPNTAASP
jgi:hypothetical protein